MSKHIDLHYDNEDIGRKIQIDEVENGIFLSIYKTTEGLEHEFEDVLLTKNDCILLSKILLEKAN